MNPRGKKKLTHHEEEEEKKKLASPFGEKKT